MQFSRRAMHSFVASECCSRPAPSQLTRFADIVPLSSSSTFTFTPHLRNRLRSTRSTFSSVDSQSVFGKSAAYIILLPLTTIMVALNTSSPLPGSYLHTTAFSTSPLPTEPFSMYLNSDCGRLFRISLLNNYYILYV